MFRLTTDQCNSVRRMRDSGCLKASPVPVVTVLYGYCGKAAVTTSIGLGSRTAYKAGRKRQHKREADSRCTKPGEASGVAVVPSSNQEPLLDAPWVDHIQNSAIRKIANIPCR